MDEFNKNEEVIETEVEAPVDTTDETTTSENVSDDIQQTVEISKNKVKVQTPIMIAACILIVAVLGFFCFKLFFSNSITGTWVLKTDASADETSEDGNAVIYYTFHDDKNHTASLNIGSMEVKGNWWYADENGATTDEATDTITISISYFFNGTFQYEVGGNAITGRTLTLKSGDDSSYDFVSKSIPDPDLKPVQNYKVYEKLVGEWKNDESKISYTFNSDGTCHINEMDTLIIDGVYSADGEKVDIKYIAQEEANTSFGYEINGSKLTISGLELEKVD